MFNLTRQPKEKRPHLEDVNLPLFLVMPWSRVSFENSCKNGGFRIFGMASLERARHWVPWDNWNSGTSQKVQNRKADCCTLLKRITKLKCVNSEFRSVDIHPKQGCLNWPYGTMSESP